MRVCLHAGIGVVFMLASATVSIAVSHAAGALAVGRCAAYGYAYDYATLKEAETAARQKCQGSCNRVVTTEKGCVAFAVDGHRPCGPNGYANAKRLGIAQNAALKLCYKFGGKDCVIRAWICDGRTG